MLSHLPLPLPSILPLELRPFFKNYIYLGLSKTHRIGVFPSVNLQKHTILASFPLTSAPHPTLSSSSSPPSLDLLQDSTCETDKQTVTTAEWLLHEFSLNTKSKYYHWIQLLPTHDFSHLFFDRKLEELAYGADLLLRRETVDRHYQMYSLIHPDISLSQYQWAIAVVVSRSYDDDGNRYLLPGLDFMNHCNDGNQNQVDVDIFDGFIFIVSRKAHQKDKELCINFSTEPKMSRKDATLQYGMDLQ